MQSSYRAQDYFRRASNLDHGLPLPLKHLEMATQVDKDRKLPPTTPASTGNTSNDTDARPVEGKDPDLYDPVGMAGKKAGIVQEIAQQLEEGTDVSKESPPPSK